jgi:hypothetical protein
MLYNAFASSDLETIDRMLDEADEALDSMANASFKYIKVPDYMRVKNRYIIRLKPDLDEKIYEKALTVLNEAQSIGLVQKLDNVFRGFIIEAPEKLPLDVLEAIPHIATIEEDRTLVSTQVQKLNSELWGLDTLDSKLDRDGGQYSFDLTGKGVNIYVIDSGLDEGHREFANGNRGRIVYTANSVKNIQKQDCSGHGTHVAGIIGGKNVGVAKEANVFSLRVVDCEDQTINSEVIAALDWLVANHRKPAVINISLGPKLDPLLGRYQRSDQLRNAIQGAINAGITVAVAAGNDNRDACESGATNALGSIVVGAVDRNSAKLDISNYGNCVTLYAPGGDVLSAQAGGGYQLRSGTSQATPFAAGVAALYLQRNPGATPADVRNALIQNAMPLRQLNSLFLQSVSIPTGIQPDIIAFDSLDTITAQSQKWWSFVRRKEFIIGVAAAGGFFVIALVACLICCCRKKKEENRKMVNDFDPVMITSSDRRNKMDNQRGPPKASNTRRPSSVAIPMLSAQKKNPPRMMLDASFESLDLAAGRRKGPSPTRKAYR